MIEPNDIELDLINYGKAVDTETESILHIRQKNDGVFVYYLGLPENLVNAIISSMHQSKDLFEIINASLTLFGESEFNVTENGEEVFIKDIYSKYNLICSSLVTMFAEKHNIKFDGYLHGIVGSKAIFGKDVLSMGDVVYDLESEQPQNAIWKFQDSDENDYKDYCKWLEENSYYCDSCDSAIEFEEADYRGSQPICPLCERKLM